MALPQLWFLTFVIAIIVMFSNVRVKKEESGSMVSFDIIFTSDSKRTVLGYIIMDIALIGLIITVALTLLTDWFYALCVLSTLVVCWKGFFQPQCDAVAVYLEEVREKRRTRE